MSLTTLSLLQALHVWSALEQAYHSNHPFGGDTAEIYAFRLHSHDPRLVEDTSEISPWTRTAQERQGENAATALLEICRLFEAERNCQVLLVDHRSDRGQPLQMELLRKGTPQRWHLRVTHPEEAQSRTP